MITIGKKTARGTPRPIDSFFTERMEILQAISACLPRVENVESLFAKSERNVEAQERLSASISLVQKGNVQNEVYFPIDSWGEGNVFLGRASMAKMRVQEKQKELVAEIFTDDFEYTNPVYSLPPIPQQSGYTCVSAALFYIGNFF